MQPVLLTPPSACGGQKSLRRLQKPHYEALSHVFAPKSRKFSISLLTPHYGVQHLLLTPRDAVRAKLARRVHF